MIRIEPEQETPSPGARVLPSKLSEQAQKAPSGVGMQRSLQKLLRHTVLTVNHGNIIKYFFNVLRFSSTNFSPGGCVSSFPK